MFTGPKIKRDNLLLSLDALNYKSYIRDYNLMSDNDWTVDGPTHLNDMYDYSSNNRLVLGNNPWGNEVVLWEGYSVPGSEAGAGIYGEPKNIDNTKMYRMSWWEKRVDNSTATYARYYAGLNGYGSVNGVLVRDTPTIGQPNTNPYFWSSTLPVTNDLPEGEWCLVVGHVWPSGSGVGPNHIDSGIYSLNGNKLQNISTDYIMIPETQTIRSRTLAIYKPDADGVVHHSLYPRLDLCDGTEPSIYALINAKGKQWQNLYGSDKLEIVGPKWNPNGYFSFRGNGTRDGVIAGDHISGFGGIADTRLYNDGMSIVWWQRFTGDNPTGHALFNGSQTMNHIELRDNNLSDGGSFRTESGATNGYSFGSSVIPGGSLLNKWCKFAIVFDFTTSPRTVKWYYNGELFHAHSDFDSSTAGVNEYFSFDKFGKSTGNTTYLYTESFKGDLAKMDIYGGPLNDGEVREYFNGFRKRFGL